MRGSAVIGPRRHRAMDALATYVSDDDERSVDAGVDAEREALALSGVGHSSECINPETSAGGRVRSFPHVEGDFATHVHVAIEVPVGSRVALARALAAIVTRVPTLRPVGRDLPVSISDVRNDPEALLPESGQTHLSLSRAFSTRADGHSALLNSLRRRLAPTAAWTATVGPGFNTFVNDEKSSTFLALEVVECSGDKHESNTKQSAFLATVHDIDTTLTSKGYPPFYENPKPHVSVLWAPGDIADKVELAVRDALGTGTNSSSVSPGISPGIHSFDWQFNVDVSKITCHISGKPGVTVWGRADLPSVEGLEPRVVAKKIRIE